MDDTQAVDAFAALAHPDRFAILRMLVQAGPSGRAAGDIAEALGSSPSRASFHLKGLANVRLIKAERQGQIINYRVDFDSMGALLAFMLEDCCGGHPTVRTCCRVAC